MPIFNDNSVKIINSLNHLTNNQLRVLFGNTKSFRNWLINEKIKDIIFLPNIDFLLLR